MAVALLRDVVEDSHFTFEDLRGEGIPLTIVEAVRILTKVEGESYDQFVGRVSENELASKNKIADIEDNINILRLNLVEEKDLKQVAKYHKAWKTLQARN